MAQRFHHPVRKTKVLNFGSRQLQVCPPTQSFWERDDIIWRRKSERFIVRTGQPQALPHTTAGSLFYSAVLSVTAVTPSAHPKGGAGLHPLQIRMFKKNRFLYT